MKLANNAPSIWPGYVAAIASLVLSLLLLLAILVFALTQIGNLVSRFRADIVRGLLEAESQSGENLQSKETASAVQVAPIRPELFDQKGTNQTNQPVLRQIKLIFSSGLAEIPASYRSVVANAIQGAQHSTDLGWQIRATVLPQDLIMQRATYQLMLSVRQALVAQMYSEKRITLRLEQSGDMPPGYQLGEVIVVLTPVNSKQSNGSAP